MKHARQLILTLSFFLCFSSFLFSSAHAGNQLNLTPDEQALLTKMGHITMCVDPNWMPYERITSNGKHEGIIADFMTLISQRINTDIRLYPTNSWTQSINAIKNRHCDILSLALKTEDRAVFLDFTEPYAKYPFVVVTTNDKSFIDDIESNTNQQYAVTRGYSVIQQLKKTYPQVQTVEVDNIFDGLEAVNKGHVFGYIDSALTATYAIKKSGLRKLTISGIIDHRSTPSIATRNDYPLLKSIFNKSLATITQEEKQKIYSHWVAIRVDGGVDYTTIWQVGALIITFMGGILFWNQRLLTANKQAKNAIKDRDKVQRTLEEKNLQLERLASTDLLTGLCNRMKTDESLEQEIQRFHRYKTPFSVIMLDLDHFKMVNDCHGHQTGDLVLTELATVLNKHSRTSDCVGRWGGEEFLIICPNTQKEGSITLANTLRQAIDQHTFTTIEHITASFGVSSIQENETSKELISRADKALYLAKKNGRNRVET